MEICHYRGFGSDIFALRHIGLLYDMFPGVSTVFLIKFHFFIRKIQPEQLSHNRGFFLLQRELRVLRIFHFHQGQPLRRSCGARRLAVTGRYHIRDFTRSSHTKAYVQQSSRDNADHIIQEAVSRHTNADDIALFRHIQTVDSPHCGLGLGMNTAEALEIMLSQKMQTGCLHLCHIQLLSEEIAV